MDTKALISELKFKAVRSSGSGGQHVNKVASKVELHFDVMASNVLKEDQKALLLDQLKTRLTAANILILFCDETRSQHKNKALVIERFLEIISMGLEVKKERIPTKTPKAVIKKRLENKRRQASKKANRKKPDMD